MENLALQHHEINLFENGGSYINCKRIYFSYYKKIPNVKVIKNINETLFYKWLDTHYGSEILKTHSSQMYSVRKKGMRSVNTIYFLTHELMIDIEDGYVVIAHQEEQEATALQIIQQLKKIIRRQKTKHEFCLISSSSHGLHTYEIDLKKPKLDLQKHYNDDIEGMHYTTLKSLRQKNKSGLILLHGIPGTGKSTYIRYLIHQLKKKVIFMPPNFAKSLEAPEVTRLLIENANTIFVIEDAEDLLVSRDQFKNSSISMLLNLTDGLLGESLGIQIIATFNTHISNIDKALLRKGRLIGLYEFKPLSIEKSKVLIEENGISNAEIKHPMTLADIYNKEQNEFTYTSNKRASIGFCEWCELGNFKYISIIKNKIMDIEKLRVEINSINLEIKEKLSEPQNNRFPIYDGAVNLESYYNSKIKIMWILKEAYDLSENKKGDWHYSEILKGNNIFHDFLEGEPYRATWDPIIYASFGILNEFKEWGKMEYIRDEPLMCNILHNIAIINTQKLPANNGTISYSNEINDAYTVNRDILQKQIITLQPDIIIGGNTLSLYKEMFNLDDKNFLHSNSNTMTYYLVDNKLFFDAYHPAQRIIKEKDYVDDIILAAKDWYNNK